MRSGVYNARVSGRVEKRSYFRSGELARLAGVSADTLRHYERRGLLAPPRRSANGYREYPESALDRVRLIRSALAVGFTIEELARILKLRDRGGAPCAQVRALAATKLGEAEARLIEIKSFRDRLRALLGEWDAVLATKQGSERAGLLESLATNGGADGKSHSPLAPLQLNKKRRKKEIDE
jgi:DNA-binding transcriptional MerR regulator